MESRLGCAQLAHELRTFFNVNSEQHILLAVFAKHTNIVPCNILKPI